MTKLSGSLFGLTFLITLSLLAPASSQAVTVRTIAGPGCSQQGNTFCSIPAGDDLMASAFTTAYFDFTLSVTANVLVEVNKRTETSATTYVDSTTYSNLAAGTWDKGLTLVNTKTLPSHWDYVWTRISPVTTFIGVSIASI